MDVQFLQAIITDEIAQYAVQDFEALPDGDAPIFNNSFQSGQVFLSNDLITEELQSRFNVAYEDFEIYPDTEIFVLDKSVSEGAVAFLAGYLYPSL